MEKKIKKTKLKIYVTSPTEHQIFQDVPINIQGHVKSKLPLISINIIVTDSNNNIVDEKSLSFDPAYNFSGQVNLVSGWNILNITATDNQQKKSSININVCYNDPAHPDNSCGN